MVINDGLFEQLEASPLVEMLLFLVFKDNFATYFAFCGVAIALHGVGSYFDGWHFFMAIGTSFHFMRIRFLFLVITAI
jgi:hypothetical protein